MLLFQVSYKEEWPSRNVQSSMLWQKEREGEDPEWIYIQYMSEKVPINGMFNETPFCVNEINMGGGGETKLSTFLFFTVRVLYCVYITVGGILYILLTALVGTPLFRSCFKYIHIILDKCVLFMELSSFQVCEVPL